MRWRSKQTPRRGSKGGAVGAGGEERGIHEHAIYVTEMFIAFSACFTDSSEHFNKINHMPCCF